MKDRGLLDSGTEKVHIHIQKRLFSIGDGTICEIKGFNGRVIGKGRIDGNHREVVHNHVVDYMEKVLLIVDVVFDPNACLYLGQQGCAENLGDLGSGSYVVWLKSLVKPTS